MSVTANLYHSADCRDRLDFDATWESQVLHADTICAGSATKRASWGDSGGPLIVAYSGEGDTQWLQVGVNNRFAKDRNAAKPLSSVYARVSSFAAWIETTTQGAVSAISSTMDAEQLTTRLSQVQAQVRSLEQSVRSLHSKRDRLKRLLEQWQTAEGQDRALQTKEEGFLNSAATHLPR